ncbi:MAG: hypothetical protein NTU80_14075 [Verrucomicrobia bacterium]|nr:hypothetical protein [Verrucomicrobiota bacterium]
MTTQLIVLNKTSNAFAGATHPYPLADTVDIKAISAYARMCLGDTETRVGFIDQLSDYADRLFTGRMWSYQPINLLYHDYAHTLEATHVFLSLATASRQHLTSEEVISPRAMELGLAAILLHDTGYLMIEGDTVGTGAKYTHCHVLRSCAIAASLLPALGCTQPEIEDVLGAIRCTGLNGNPTKTHFSTPQARRIACMVATADYVGQMSAPSYPSKLPYLFDEFAEADTYCHIPPEKRPFKSVEQLLDATPAFWAKFVLPKLTNDFGGVYHYLATPYPDGPNPYLEAIENNLAIISGRPRPAEPS